MILVFDSIDAQRKVAGPVVTTLIWLMLPVIVGFRWFQDVDVLDAAVAGLLCAIAATAIWKTTGETTLGRSLPGVILMAQISILVASGGAWQIDLHMAYFAGLALLIIYCDWVVILAAAMTVAIHHVVLTYVVPSAVFSGAASLGRVELHAVILTVEAGILIWVTANLSSSFAVAARSIALAQEAVLEARASTAMANEARGAEKQAQGRAGAVGDEARAQERTTVVNSIGTAIAFLKKGDLTHRIAQDLPGEYAKLRDDFNDAVVQLCETMTVVAANASAIHSGIAAITDGANDLSERTEQQAAGLEETVASLDEITATVRKTSGSASHAQQVTALAKANAEQSGQVMQQAVEAMSGIERSSREISQITSVIDEIAFQTNLLALNAGVEAARAGDAGRGFAVVASEVRALAQRSADAAKQIKELISTSRVHVEQGVDFVAQTGEALNGIVTQVNQINVIVAEISASAQEQSGGLDQVNTAINQMDQVIQQNAALVSQSTEASQALAEEAGEMSRLVNQFNVGKVVAPLPDRRASKVVRRPDRPGVVPIQPLRASRGGAAMAPKLTPEAEGWTEF